MHGKKKLKRVQARQGSHHSSSKRFAAASTGKKPVAKMAKLSSDSESEDEGDDSRVSLMHVYYIVLICSLVKTFNFVNVIILKTIH